MRKARAGEGVGALTADDTVFMTEVLTHPLKQEFVSCDQVLLHPDAPFGQSLPKDEAASASHDSVCS